MSVPETPPQAPHPLGATCDGQGVHFALFSEHADAVDLCLFDPEGAEVRVPASRDAGHVWRAFVAGAAAGQRYGWRAHGPYAPAEGDRFNPNKLLVDPYARALEGRLDLRGPVYGYRRADGLDDAAPCGHDDAAFKPRSVVFEDRFDWARDRPPGVPWADAVVYEVHVKGFTRRHPGVPDALRGTFLGLASDAAVAHLRSLGITTVELMPVQAWADEPAVAARGLTNYWGYNPIAYFAPDERLAAPRAAGGQGAVRDFKRMVRRLHAEGIEVVLDVVYNHTAEGDRWGPTIALRGIDDRVYYRKRPGDPGDYLNVTGCGNTLDTSHPQVVKLVADSLRYWVEQMHVDGFRFDLAAALGRAQDGAFDPRAAFFAVLHQDPVLGRVKLVAEPWDLGEGGLRLGEFSHPWAEWNGRFRDTVRRFWRGERTAVADMGYRLTGSSDRFAGRGRVPQASVNYVASHDGFTLRDTVTYERKHNEANGEHNLDGPADDFSQSCGVEGETEDARVVRRRRTIARSLLATVFVSRGVPMLQMGDDLWRTQRGNNNAYCQDSELAWIDWIAAERDPFARSMRDFAASLAAFRARHPALRGGAFLRGEPAVGGAQKDITWLRTDGAEMEASDWANPARACIAFHLAGVAGTPGLLVLMNGDREATAFALPPRFGLAWRVELDTRERAELDGTLRAPSSLLLDPGALVAMAEVTPGSP